MRVIVGPRQCGKTTALIKESAETGAMIVCVNRNMCKMVEDMARKLKLSIPPPNTHSAIINHFFRGMNWDRGFLIDDVDLFLQTFMCGMEIKGVTMTGELDQDEGTRRKTKGSGAKSGAKSRRKGTRMSTFVAPMSRLVRHCGGRTSRSATTTKP